MCEEEEIPLQYYVHYVIDGEPYRATFNDENEARAYAEKYGGQYEQSHD